MPDEPKRPFGGPDMPPAPVPQAQPPAPPMGQFSVDTSTLSVVYANFCRVTGTPEELVLDFGLNTQMSRSPASR